MQSEKPQPFPFPATLQPVAPDGLFVLAPRTYIPRLPSVPTPHSTYTCVRSQYYTHIVYTYIYLNLMNFQMADLEFSLKDFEVCEHIN